MVGITDELTGQAVNAFVALKDGNEKTDQVRMDLTMQIRRSIGPFAAPKAVFVVEDLPKTASGKIMRRILRKIISREEDSLGDTSTVRIWISPSQSFGTTANGFTALRPQRCGQDHRNRPHPARSKVKVYEFDDNDVGERWFADRPNPDLGFIPQTTAKV